MKRLLRVLFPALVIWLWLPIYVSWFQHSREMTIGVLVLVIFPALWDYAFSDGSKNGR